MRLPGSQAAFTSYMAIGPAVGVVVLTTLWRGKESLWQRVGYVAVCAVLVLYPPGWILVSTLTGSQWLAVGLLPAVGALLLTVAMLMGLWYRANRLTALSGNPFSGLSQLLQGAPTDTPVPPVIPVSNRARTPAGV